MAGSSSSVCVSPAQWIRAPGTRLHSDYVATAAPTPASLGEPCYGGFSIGGSTRRGRLFTKGCRATTRAWRHPLARPWSMRPRRGWRSPRSPPPPTRNRRRASLQPSQQTTSTSSSQSWRCVFDLRVSYSHKYETSRQVTHSRRE